MSVNIMKLHKTEGYAVLRHNFREGDHHGNRHIDPTRKKENHYLYTKENSCKTASSAYRKLRARVREIDKEKPPIRRRQDRVTMLAFEIPAPAGLPADKEQQFFQIAYSHIARMCGGNSNVSQMFIHHDEIHDYIDPVDKTSKTSRVHGHMVGLPYTIDKGINCKSFLTRSSMSKLQHDIDKDCRKRLGIAFLTGEQTHSYATVDQLKEASEKASQELLERVEETKRRKDFLDVAYPEIAAEYAEYMEYLEFDASAAQDIEDIFHDDDLSL